MKTLTQELEETESWLNFARAKAMREDDKQRFPPRRKDKKSRSFVDNEFFSRGYAAKYRKISLLDVYCVLTKYANYKTQECFPGYERIMEESGQKNRNKVARALKKLEELNIIRIKHSRGRGSNVYRLLDVSVWKNESSAEAVIGLNEPYQN